jgi:hypothetical protein
MERVVESHRGDARSYVITRKYYYINNSAADDATDENLHAPRLSLSVTIKRYQNMQLELLPEGFARHRGIRGVGFLPPFETSSTS